MELKQSSDLDRAAEAKKRVEELKGFYVHLIVYLMANTFISVGKITRNMYNGESFSEAFWDMGTFLVWIFWGIGLAYHAMQTFQYNPFFGKGWEERKIKEFMNEEEQQSKWN